MATITRVDLANALRDRFGLTAADSYKMIDIIFDEIGQSLVNGEEVKITGFGTFTVAKRAARTGRNPATGKTIKIAATKAPKFKAGALLKKAVK